MRSRCSTDFATQRQLLTRVSTQRSPPPESERPKVDVFAETAVRSPPPVPTTPNVAAVAQTDTGVVTSVARPANTVPMSAPALEKTAVSGTLGRPAITPAAVEAESSPALEKTALPGALS